jgi:RNA polymerase sigma-70 factor, ECF subfamily
MTSWYARRLQHLRPGRGSQASSAGAITEALRHAWEQRDTEQLTAAVTRRATLTMDSGCETPGLSGVVTGRADVGAALLRLTDTYHPASVEPAEVNGGPGILLRSGARVVGVIAVAIRGGRVDQLWAVLNPDKLTHWNLC